MNDGLSQDAERKMQFLFQLRQKGVTDTRVLTAMENVDRGDYVRGHFAGRAYEDTPLPIASGQTISQPSVVGLMTQALSVQPRDTVLEVGTGSGYQAAILSQLARRVYTVDRHRNLTREAELAFTKQGLANITIITGDGCFGLPEQGPFDRIIVTAAAEDPPGPLLHQLNPAASWWCPWANPMPCNPSSRSRAQNRVLTMMRSCPSASYPSWKASRANECGSDERTGLRRGLQASEL